MKHPFAQLRVGELRVEKRVLRRTFNPQLYLLSTLLCLLCPSAFAAYPGGGTASAITESAVSVFDGVPSFSANVLVLTRTNLSGNLTITHSTNRTANTRFATVAMYGAATNCVLTLNTNWQFYGCTATNTILSNRWSRLYLECFGGTTETNVHCKLETQ